MTTQQATPAGQLEGLRQSRIGKRHVEIPKGVTVTIKDGHVDVKGPKGQLGRALPENVSVKIDGTTLTVLPTIPGRDGARFQGLARALINSMVVGTSARTPA